MRIIDRLQRLQRGRSWRRRRKWKKSFCWPLHGVGDSDHGAP